MTDRKLSAFVDALVAGRRPGSFKAEPADAEVIRTAIALRAARPGDAIPDEAFVSDLHQKLSDQASSTPASNVRPLKVRRARAALVGIAASVALVGGTVVATDSFNHAAVTTAVAVPRGPVIRTASFETASGSVLGQIVVYGGHPSWVYMKVGVPESSGTIKCKLQLNTGSVVAAGTIELHRGSGEMTKTIGVDVSRLRGAQLFNSSGAVVGSATFA